VLQQQSATTYTHVNSMSSLSHKFFNFELKQYESYSNEYYFLDFFYESTREREKLTWFKSERSVSIKAAQAAMLTEANDTDYTTVNIDQQAGSTTRH
jgi:predicted lipid-binding transport protein (Tim44 family)